MKVRIPNTPELLQIFMRAHIGKILPPDATKKFKKTLECGGINDTQFKKIMNRYMVVVGKKKVKLDGGSKKRTKRRTKRRGKSNKRRTKKNQKGGVLGEFIIYSFGFVSLLAIALCVVATPFILIKDCYNEHRINETYRIREQEDADRRRTYEDNRDAMFSPYDENAQQPVRYRLDLGKKRAIKAVQRSGKNFSPDQYNIILSEDVTRESAETARDGRQ